jgi:MHS family alpha-ketoglutarate permease-like MFS transporter
MLLFAGLGALCVIPITSALHGATSPIMAGALITAALAIVSLYTSVAGIIKAEMFPMEVRALGVGLAYALANALFGGSAEYVALLFKSLGHEADFYIYVTVMMAVVFLICLRLPSEGRYLHDDF